MRAGGRARGQKWRGRDVGMLGCVGDVVVASGEKGIGVGACGLLFRSAKHERDPQMVIKQDGGCVKVSLKMVGG